MSDIRLQFKNTTLLTLAGGAAKVLYFLASLIVYRELPKDQAGVFFIGLAFAVTAIVVSELGLRGYLIRELAILRENHAAARTLFATMITARLILMGLSFPILVLVLWLGEYSDQVRWCSMWLWGYAAIESASLYCKAALRSYDLMKQDAVLSFIGRAIVLISIFILAQSDRLTIGTLTAAFTVGPTLELIGVLWILKKGSPLSLLPNWDKIALRAVLASSLPLGIMLIASNLYYRTGAFVLSQIDSLSRWLNDSFPSLDAGQFQPEVSVAELSGAGRLPDGINFLPIAIINALLPFLTRNRNNVRLVNQYYNVILKYLGLAGAAVSALMVAQPRAVILVIAGPSYLNAQPAFQAYGVAVFFSFLQYSMSSLIITLGFEKRLVRRYVVALFINIALSLGLAPKYGVAGVAAAYAASEMLSTFMDVLLLRTEGFKISGHTVALWLAPTVIILGCTWALSTMPSLTRAGATITITSLAIALIGLRDWRKLRHGAGSNPLS